jgi:hypothetical protein
MQDLAPRWPASTWRADIGSWPAGRRCAGGLRPRRSRFGELVQWDTSDHDWLEGRGKRLYLIGMIDDATSRALARFVDSDSTAEKMGLLERWLLRHGHMQGCYTDKAGLFQTAPKTKRGEQREGVPALPGLRAGPAGNPGQGGLCAQEGFACQWTEGVDEGLYEEARTFTRSGVGCAAAPCRKGREGKGARYRETLQATGFHRHDGIYRSDVISTQKPYKPGGGVPPPVGRPRAPVPGRHGRRALYPPSAMSSGRLLLDRVARQQNPSPLHRKPGSTGPWGKFLFCLDQRFPKALHVRMPASTMFQTRI